MKWLISVFCLAILFLSFQTALLITPFSDLQKDLLQKNPVTELNEQEVSHMRDVRSLLFATHVVSLIAVVGAAFLFRKYPKIKLLRLASKIMLVFFIVFGLFSLAFFPFVFTLFHKVFFDSGSWIFPVDSVLIRAFPFSFFTGFVIKWFLFGVGLSLLLWKGFYKKKSSSEL